MLPSTIQNQFIAVLTGRLSVADFEQWVYRTPELETYLSADDYLELIGLNYKSSKPIWDLEPLLSRYINWSELRQAELLNLLHNIAERTTPDEIYTALVTCYDWYYRGCRFLEVLGMRFGLRADLDYGLSEMHGRWHGLSEKQKQLYLDSFYPEAKLEAEKVIGWLTDGLIQFANDSYPSAEDYIHYVDNRPDITSEREPTAISEASGAVRRPWWKFWQRRG